MTGGSCKAWMLPQAQGRYVAIGEHEMVHIIPEWVRLQPIPHCPDYCHKVFVWQGQLIPVFELQTYLWPQDSVTTDAAQEATPIICIVAYENDNHVVGYGGLLLNALPFRTDVIDDQLCSFPDDYHQWDDIAVSCFSDPVGGPTPVLDLPRIFCSAPR